MSETCRVIYDRQEDMAASPNTHITSPGKWYQSDCDSSASECSKCVSFLTRLQSALEEIESSKQIIKLLQQESIDNLNDGNRVNKTTHTPYSPNTQTNSKRLKFDKWIVSTTKCQRKNSPLKNSTEINNFYVLPTANRYEPLNLQIMAEQDATPQTLGRDNPSNTPNPEHRTRLQLQHRVRIKQVDKENRENLHTYEIPTLLYGKAENKFFKVKISEGTHLNNMKDKKSEQHQIVMFGDSFLRRIRENVALSLSSKYCTYSMVKPGCELNTLLESVNRTAGNITQKDVIVICGGSNNLNQNKVKLAINCIREFIERHSHTNIILANVPI